MAFRSRVLSRLALSTSLLGAVSAALFFGVACGGEDSGTAAGSGFGNSGGFSNSGGTGALAGAAGTGTGGSGNGGSGILDGGISDVASIAIDPPTATLNSTDGAQPTQVFKVIGTLENGSSQELTTADVVLSELSIGDLEPNSLTFTANGLVGGVTTVEATLGSLTASATVTVQLDRTFFENGAPMNSADSFLSPVSDPARAAGLVYPLDQAVMPQNVFPADIQWLNGVENDLFRITIKKPNATVTTYALHSGAGFGNHWQVDGPAWRTIAQTNPDDQAVFTVDRFEVASGQALLAETPVNVTFAKAALTGSVYYWDILAGRIQRIDDGVGQAVSFMPTPPDSRTAGEKCVGCHSVSNSGRYMAGRLGGGDNIGAIFDLTQDLTGASPPTVWPVSRDPGPLSLTWWDSSWNPEDTRLVAAFRADDGAIRQLKIYDPLSGVEVPTTGTLPMGLQPSWSPDGNKIAYVSNSDSWGGQMTDSDLGIMEVVGLDSFGGNTQVHEGAALAGASEGGTTDSYPSWAPSSGLIVFAHGTGARSDFPDGMVSALYAMAPDGSGVVRLDTACGGVDSRDDFQPNFSPFDEGGYFWMTFLSRRDYGNGEAGTRGTQRQQVWVAAIKKDAAPGTDPSAVGYWLPGQDPASKNISAFWAPRPCRQDGEDCTVSSECCGGDCRPGDGGALVCSPPPPDRCRQLNETCTTSADCCDGRECVGNVCIDDVPK